MTTDFTKGRNMPVLTAAQNKAAELRRQGAHALEKYLENWRDRAFNTPAEYVLAVIHEYEKLSRTVVAPDLKVGDLLLVCANHRALWKGTDVNLTVTEFRVTKFLLDNIGNFVTYRAIYDVVHYAGFMSGIGNSGYMTNVRSMVKRVRRKFETADEEFDQIENYSSFGYRWLPQATLPVVAIVTPILDGAISAP